MARYSYRARNAAGRVVQGTLQAASEDRARALLRANGLRPLDVTVGKRSSLLNRTIVSRKVHVRDLILLSRQLATMIRAGVPILAAIKALHRQVDQNRLRRVLEGIAYDIEGGDSLSNALAKHPDVFSLFYLGVVRTGEASGTLEHALDVLSRYLEQNYEFTRKVRAAVAYPLFVLVGVVLVVGLLFSFVMPQLVLLFDEAAVQLPLPTQILVVTTRFVQRFWYLGILLVVALGILGRYYLKTPEGQYTASSLALRLPIASQLFTKLNLSRLTSILHTLFSSDVPVIESLKIARASINNAVYQQVLSDTIEAVQNGSSISAVWEHQPHIPAMLSTMVAVGENSGEVERAFSESQRFFQRDVEDMLAQITVFLEPALVVLLGLGVALVVAGVLLPIYNLVLVI